MKHWCLEYVDKPWVAAAEGPEAYDCWGLLKAVYKNKLGVDLHDYGQVNRHSLREITAQMDHPQIEEEWVRVRIPQEGDAVALSQRNKYHHVGVYIDYHGGHVLHSADNDRVIVEPIGSMSRGVWRKIHYYRHISKLTSE